MSDDEKKYLTILGAAGLVGGLLTLGIILKERKARRKSNQWTMMTLQCLFNFAERLETVMEDPETNIDDLVTALYEETAFINIVLDENPPS